MRWLSHSRLQKLTIRHRMKICGQIWKYELWIKCNQVYRTQPGSIHTMRKCQAHLPLTITLKVQYPFVSFWSCTEQFTLCLPIFNIEPDFGEHTIAPCFPFAFSVNTGERQFTVTGLLPELANCSIERGHVKSRVGICGIFDKVDVNGVFVTVSIVISADWRSLIFWICSPIRWILTKCCEIVVFKGEWPVFLYCCCKSLVSCLQERNV